MTLKSLIRYGFTISAICLPVWAFADDLLIKNHFSIETDHETVTAIKPDPGPIGQQEKKFTFDWNQHATIAANKNKIAEEEKFISKINDVSKLNNQEQQSLGMLFYKLGTYYVHVSHEPDLAITKLTMANALLTDLLERAWSYNQLAYAYEQRYASMKLPEDKEKALFYVNKVISELLPDMKSKSIAFAYFIKGMIQNDAKEYSEAEKNFKLANALLGQQGHDQEAITMLKQLKRYWSINDHLNQDP